MACKFCTIQIVLLVIAFLIIIGISDAFFYFGWYLKEIILILLLMLYTDTGTVIY